LAPLVDLLERGERGLELQAVLFAPRAGEQLEAVDWSARRAHCI
jgi:hypothetical protein